MPKRASSRTPDSQRKSSGDGYKGCDRRRRSKSEWRANAIDPDTLPVACEPCRCTKRGKIRPLPYNLRDRAVTQTERTVEEIPDEEIAQDLTDRIAGIPVPGRPLPSYHNIIHLSQELKLRLAMAAEEIEEITPLPGSKYTYRSFRPESRIVEIHDEIDEEYEHEITLRIKLENMKKAALWDRNREHAKTV